MNIRFIYGWLALLGIPIMFDWTDSFGSTGRKLNRQKQANTLRARWRPDSLQPSFKAGFADATWGFG